MLIPVLKDKASPSNLAAELVRQQIFFRRELSERIGWFIGLRWIAIVLAQISAWTAGLFRIQLPLIPITISVFRAENAKSLTDQGTGLGLMIVKEAIDLLHGVILIESRQHQGTCVTCWFPVLK